jgi:hypothetical protein
LIPASHASVQIEPGQHELHCPIGVVIVQVQA